MSFCILLFYNGHAVDTGTILKHENLGHHLTTRGKQKIYGKTEKNTKNEFFKIKILYHRRKQMIFQKMKL